jgi:hypothetical protein
LLAPRPTPKLEDHPSSAVRGCLFNLFTATLHIGGRSSIRNLRTRHAMVIGTHIHGLQKHCCEKLKTSLWGLFLTASAPSSRVILLHILFKQVSCMIFEVLLLLAVKSMVCWDVTL